MYHLSDIGFNRYLKLNEKTKNLEFVTKSIDLKKLFKQKKNFKL